MKDTDGEKQPRPEQFRTKRQKVEKHFDVVECDPLNLKRNFYI